MRRDPKGGNGRGRARAHHVIGVQDPFAIQKRGTVSVKLENETSGSISIDSNMVAKTKRGKSSTHPFKDSFPTSSSSTLLLDPSNLKHTSIDPLDLPNPLNLMLVESQVRIRDDSLANELGMDVEGNSEENRSPDLLGALDEIQTFEVDRGVSRGVGREVGGLGFERDGGVSLLPEPGEGRGRREGGRERVA